MAKGKETVIYSLNKVLIQMQPSVHTYFDRDISILQCKLCAPSAKFSGEKKRGITSEMSTLLLLFFTEHSVLTYLQEVYPLMFHTATYHYHCIKND